MENKIIISVDIGKVSGEFSSVQIYKIVDNHPDLILSLSKPVFSEFDKEKFKSQVIAMAELLNADCTGDFTTIKWGGRKVSFTRINFLNHNEINCRKNESRD